MHPKSRGVYIIYYLSVIARRLSKISVREEDTSNVPDLLSINIKYYAIVSL